MVRINDLHDRLKNFYRLFRIDTKMLGKVVDMVSINISLDKMAARVDYNGILMNVAMNLHLHFGTSTSPSILIPI